MNIKHIFKKIPRGQLAQNTILSLFWQGTRILLLTAWLIGLARLLGAEGYGLYAGITAVAVTLGSFSGLGLGWVMYQNVITAPEAFSERWNEALWMTTVTGCILFFIFLALCVFTYTDISTYTIVAIGVAEVFFYPLMTTCTFAFASKHKIGWSSALPSIMALFRCIAIAVFFTFSIKKNIDMYVWYHLFGTGIASLFIIMLVKKVLNPTPQIYELKIDNIYRGIGFCFSWASSNAFSSIDKSIVLKTGGSEMSGLYSSSFRLASIFMQPIDALISAATPALFLLGAKKYDQPSIIRYIVVALITYSTVAGLVLFTLPDVFIWILGPSFIEAKKTIQLFSLLIPCYALRALGAHILLTRGKIKMKITTELIGLCLLFFLGILLIPVYGLNGAAIIAIITESIVAAICWLLIFKKVGMQK